jgi:hypothetical protein
MAPSRPSMTPSTRPSSTTPEPEYEPSLDDRVLFKDHRGLPVHAAKLSKDTEEEVAERLSTPHAHHRPRPRREDVIAVMRDTQQAAVRLTTRAAKPPRGYSARSAATPSPTLRGLGGGDGDDENSSLHLPSISGGRASPAGSDGFGGGASSSTPGGDGNDAPMYGPARGAVKARGGSARLAPSGRASPSGGVSSGRASPSQHYASPYAGAPRASPSSSSSSTPGYQRRAQSASPGMRAAVSAGSKPAAAADYTPAKADQELVAEEECGEEFPAPPGGHPSMASPSFASISTPLAAAGAGDGDALSSPYNNVTPQPQSSPLSSLSSSRLVVSSSEDPHAAVSMLARSSSGFRHASARAAGTANGRSASGRRAPRAGAPGGAPGGRASDASGASFSGTSPSQPPQPSPPRSGRGAASGRATQQRSGGFSASGAAVEGVAASGGKKPITASGPNATNTNNPHNANNTSTKDNAVAWSWDPRGGALHVESS